jgi:hypothetical protein
MPCTARTGRRTTRGAPSVAPSTGGSDARGEQDRVDAHEIDEDQRLRDRRQAHGRCSVSPAGSCPESASAISARPLSARKRADAERVEEIRDGAERDRLGTCSQLPAASGDNDQLDNERCRKHGERHEQYDDDHAFYPPYHDDQREVCRTSWSVQSSAATCFGDG